MSSSPAPAATGADASYPPEEARKRKRPREESQDNDDGEHQTRSNEYGNGQNGSVTTHQAGESSFGAVSPPEQPAYVSKYGKTGGSGSSYPTSTTTDHAAGASHQAQPQSSSTSSQPSLSPLPQQSGNGTPSASASTSATGSTSTSTSTSTRPAQTNNRRERVITKDTLEPSYFMVEPNDEFTREVGDWLWGWIANRANVEIEGKIGLLVDARPNLPPKTRVSFPLATETILTDTTFARFQSNMSLRQHHHFNQILNMRATEAASPNYSGAPIRYLHTREIDSFYHSTRSISGGSAGKTKVRVTRDQSSNNTTIKSSVMKSRIADMNIYSPKRGFDFRISVSVEEPVPVPTSKPTHERWKDRVSYKHQAFQIDLTQVRSSESKEVLHELEIEFSDMPLLMHEGEKAFRGEESIYYDLVQVFLNNIRMLIRNACPP